LDEGNRLQFSQPLTIKSDSDNRRIATELESSIRRKQHGIFIAGGGVKALAKIRVFAAPG
jgi:hypothetical protein